MDAINTDMRRGHWLGSARVWLLVGAFAVVSSGITQSAFYASEAAREERAVIHRKEMRRVADMDVPEPPRVYARLAELRPTFVALGSVCGALLCVLALIEKKGHLSLVAGLAVIAGWGTATWWLSGPFFALNPILLASAGMCLFLLVQARGQPTASSRVKEK